MSIYINRTSTKIAGKLKDFASECIKQINIKYMTE